MAGEQQRRKKAANPSVKGRSKSVKVVLLKEVPRYIPKGMQREDMRKAGYIKELPFRRIMTEEVQQVIIQGFVIEAFKFLQGSRDNTLKVNATRLGIINQVRKVGISVIRTISLIQYVMISLWTKGLDNRGCTASKLEI